MADVLKHDLEAPEPCAGKGIYIAKSYVGVRGGIPKAEKHILGRKPPELGALGAFTIGILERLPFKDRNHLIGYSVLRLCDEKHELRLERLGNYAFAKPNRAQQSIKDIRYYTDDEDICEVSYRLEGAGSDRYAVDFPATKSERFSADVSAAGLTVATALVDSDDPMHSVRASIVARPQVHFITQADLKQ
ncbi:MAG: hypothetical protein JWO41_866 [Candidatus Saccharibacteria bacterium]|nr:hypothetical protein [Candidatus Saccharibacteria bacterium]